MDLNFLVFPIPKKTILEAETKAQVIWIPQKKYPIKCNDENEFCATKSKDFGSLHKNKRDMKPLRKKQIKPQQNIKHFQKSDSDQELYISTPVSTLKKSYDSEGFSNFFSDTKSIVEQEEEETDLNYLEELQMNSSCAPDSIRNYSFCQRKGQQNSEEEKAQKPKNQFLFSTSEKDENKQRHAQNFNSSTTIETPQLKAEDNPIEKYIPCLFLRANNSPIFLIYFHGNGEDIYQSYELLNRFQNNIEINIIAMEYPGYGAYTNYDKNQELSQQILKDSETVYDYLTDQLHIKEEKIILFGRSIGSGVATHIASHRNPGILLLVSAFETLRDVASGIVGKFLSYVLKQRFDNLSNMKKVYCPTFILHGQSDQLISYKHSIKLFENCKGNCEISLPKLMTHSEFNFYSDLTFPFFKFLLKNNFDICNEENLSTPMFPYEVFLNPFKTVEENEKAWES